MNECDVATIELRVSKAELNTVCDRICFWRRAVNARLHNSLLCFAITAGPNVVFSHSEQRSTDAIDEQSRVVVTYIKACGDSNRVLGLCDVLKSAALRFRRDGATSCWK